MGDFALYFTEKLAGGCAPVKGLMPPSPPIARKLCLANQVPGPPPPLEYLPRCPESDGTLRSI
jgi:hypothetical protein